MATSRHISEDEVHPEIKDSRRHYERIHGEAPPINYPEASNGYVSVLEDERKWRDYEGQKSPTDLDSISYQDMVPGPGEKTSWDSENNWEEYDPQEEWIEEFPDSVPAAIDIVFGKDEEVGSKQYYGEQYGGKARTPKS